MSSNLYLIPTVLAEGKTESLPAYITEAVKKCSVFFVENERTARRFFKLLWKEMVIDDFEWHNMKEVDAPLIQIFKQRINAGANMGIISEAGCPGIADPGQKLVAIAHELNINVHPLVGPSSILLALMASGLNGQHFRFSGYLPIESGERVKTIRSLESESRQKNCTQVFIETPYRNNQLMESLLKTCQPDTLICVAVDLTAETEMIKTQPAKSWKNATLDLHKRPAIFLMYSGR